MAKKMPDILLQPEEPEADGEVEFEMDDGVEEEQEVTPETPITRAELEDLKKKADSGTQVAQALQQLAGQRGPAPAPEKQAGESPEQFRKRINEAIFASDDPYGLIAEIAKREVAPFIGQQGQGASQLAKKVMELDPEKGPTFKKYKKEIEEFVGQLPAEQRILPQVWEYAHTQVAARHIDDIQQEKIDQILEKKLDERLRELGIDPDKARAARPGVSYAETGGGAPQGRRRVVRYTQADLEAADRKGLSIEDYMMTKGRR